MIDKLRLRDAILAQLAADLALQTRAAQLARDEATHEESKAEGKYDTRAQEAAYLAEGQARQAAELGEAIQLYETLALPAAVGAATLGAVVHLEAGGRTTAYFLGPRGGGMEVEVEGQRVTVVTPASPLGRQLLGARVGATVSLPGRGKAIAHRVVAMA